MAPKPGTMGPLLEPAGIHYGPDRLESEINAGIGPYIEGWTAFRSLTVKFRFWHKIGIQFSAAGINVRLQPYQRKACIRAIQRRNFDELLNSRGMTDV